MENKKARVLCDHQTGYMPWLGLFHRISLCDVYVSLDTVKYTQSYYDDRNKIKTPHGFKWLKVPTLKSKSKILRDIEINNSISWKDEHLKSISFSYANTEFFDYYFGKIKKILDKNHELLIRLNEDLLKFFLDELNIEVDFMIASELNVPGTKNQYLINLCRACNANVYIFGQMGKSYADIELWGNNGIKVYFHQYNHPEFRQKFGKFEPYLSIIDLLFNEGAKNAAQIISKGNVNKQEMMGSL